MTHLKIFICLSVLSFSFLFGNLDFVNGLSLTARNVGLGRVGVVANGDTTAFYINPSLLTTFRGQAYSFSYQPWLFESSLFSGTATLGLERIGFGIQVNYLGTEPFEQINYLGLKTGKNLEASDLVVNLAVAFRLLATESVNWSIGLGSTLEGNQLADQQKTFFDLSLGTILRIALHEHQLSFGASFLNPLNSQKARTVLPLSINTGVEGEIHLSPGLFLLPSAELIYSQNLDSLRTSLEINILKIIQLRGAYRIYDSDLALSPLSFGAGLKIKYLFLDYGIRLTKDFLAPYHSFSFTVQLPYVEPSKSPNKNSIPLPKISNPQAVPQGTATKPSSASTSLSQSQVTTSSTDTSISKTELTQDKPVLEEQTKALENPATNVLSNQMTNNAPAETVTQ